MKPGGLGQIMMPIVSPTMMPSVEAVESYTSTEVPSAAADQTALEYMAQHGQEPADADYSSLSRDYASSEPKKTEEQGITIEGVNAILGTTTQSVTGIGTTAGIHAGTRSIIETVERTVSEEVKRAAALELEKKKEEERNKTLRVLLVVLGVGGVGYLVYRKFGR